MTRVLGNLPGQTIANVITQAITPLIIIPSSVNPQPVTAGPPYVSSQANTFALQYQQSAVVPPASSKEIKFGKHSYFINYSGSKQPFNGAAQEQNFSFWGSPVYMATDGTLMCPGFTGETYSKNPWDYVTLGKLKTPGLAEVMVDKKRLIVDNKKAAGNDGARLTVHGLDTAKVRIQLLIWTPDQLRALYALWASLMPVGGKDTRPNPCDCRHEKLRIQQVKSLQFVGATGPDAGPVPRARIFTMEAIEYFPPAKGKSKTVTPTAATSSTLETALQAKPSENTANLGPH